MTNLAFYAYQALPGGKIDKTDVDADYAAVSPPWVVFPFTGRSTEYAFQKRREAYEEVGLPLGYHPDLHKMTELEPFLSKYKLVVFRELLYVANNHLVSEVSTISYCVLDLESCPGREPQTQPGRGRSDLRDPARVLSDRGVARRPKRAREKGE